MKLRDVLRPGCAYTRDDLAARRCAVCGSRNAPFGVGPPLRPREAWFCFDDYQVQPETIAENIRRVNELMEDDDGRGET